MPVDKDLLKDIPVVDRSTSNKKKDVAPSSTSDDADSLLDEIPVVSRGTKTQPTDNTPPPPPVNTATAPMQSIVNGTDHQQDKTDLGLSTDYINKVLGSRFGKPIGDAQSVDTDNNRYTVTKGQPGVYIEPITRVDHAQAIVKKETDASPSYIYNDIEHNYQYLPDAVKLHVDKDHLAQTLSAPTGGIPELQAYYNTKVAILKDKYDLDKFRQDRLASMPMGHEFTAADEAKATQEDVQFQQKAADEYNTLHRAVFNVASLKVINAHLAKNEPIAPGKIGEEIRTILGEGPQVQAYQENGAVKPVTTLAAQGEPATQPITYTDLNPRASVPIPKTAVIPTPQQSQIQSDKIGFQALDYASKQAFAEGDMDKARQLFDLSKDANQKILNRFPGYKKAQVSKAIEDHIYGLANPLYTSFTGYDVSKGNIQAAARDLGIPEEDVKDITPADIKKVPDFFSKIVSGLVDGVTGLKLAPQPEAAGATVPTKVDTNPNSNTYLQDVPTEKTGNINWSAGAISNEIGAGAGQFVGFVGEAGAIAKGLRSAGVIKSAVTAERVANAATIMATSYGDNYRQGQELFGDNEAKKHIYALVNSLLMAGTNEILPKTKVAKDILGINTMAGREFIQKIEKDGIESLTEPQLRDYVVKGLKEFTKTQGVMLGISELNTVGNNISRMIMAPDANAGVFDNTKQSAVSSVLAMMLPSIATGVMHPVNQSGMQKAMLYEVGSDPQKYISEVNAQVLAGNMDPAQGKSSIDLVTRMADIVSKSVPVESIVNNKTLTRNQRIDYANNLLQEQLLQEKKSSIKDKVQTKPIDEQIKNLENQREEILTNAGEPVQVGGNAIPPEELPQHNVSSLKNEDHGVLEKSNENKPEHIGGEAEQPATPQSNVPGGEESTGQKNGEGENVLNPPATEPDAGNAIEHPASDLGFEEEPAVAPEETPPAEVVPEEQKTATTKEVSLGGKLKMAIPEDKMKNVHLVNARELATTSHQTDRNDESKQKVANLEAEGIQEPLVVYHDPETGEMELRNGNHRLDKAIELGAERVPVEIRDITGKLGPNAKKLELFPVENVEPKADNSPEALRKNNLTPDEDSRLADLEGMNSFDQYKHAQELSALRHKAYKTPDEPAHTVDTKHINIADAVKEGKYQEWIGEGRMSPEDAKVIIESANVEVPQDILDKIGKVEVPPVEEKKKPVPVSKLDRPEPTNLDNPVNTDFLNRTPADEKLSENVGENIKKKFDDATKVVGYDGHAPLPNGQEVSGHYVLTDANAITPSHNPFSFGHSDGFPMLENGRNPNDRDYTIKKNIEAVTDHASNYNGLAVKNTPTVDKNGVVIDGNDRTMSGQIAAKNGTDGVYIDNLKKNAKMYGFTQDDVESMIDRGLHPRLIFVPDEVQPYSTKTFAKFNKETQKPKNAFEVAIEHHRNLNNDIVDRLGAILDKHEEMSDFFRSVGDQKDVHSLFTREGVLNPTNSSQFYDSETRMFTDEGKKLVQNILLAKTLDEESLRVIQQHPALAEKIAKSIKNIVGIDAAAKYGLAETINNAIKLYHNVDEYAIKANLPKKDKQAALELYMRQNSLFDGTPEETQATINMFTALSNMGSRAFKDFTGQIFEYAKRNNHATGVDLFGEEKATKSQLLKDAQNAINEFERAKSEFDRNAKPNDGAEHGSGNAKVADRNIPENGKADKGDKPEVGKDEPVKPAETPAGAMAENPIENAKISNPEVVPTIDERMKGKADEINDINHKISGAEAALQKMRSSDDTATDAYKIKLKAWQQLSGKLDRAQKEYNALMRKREADGLAEKIRSKKIRGGNEGMVYGAGPVGVIAKLAQTVGKEIINGGLEVAALAVQAGYHIKVAIDRAVDYINKHYKGDPWDEKSFREAMGENDLYNNQSSPADQAAALRKMMYGEQKLTQKNEAIANSMVKEIQDGKTTLHDTIQKINDDKLSEPTKKAIVQFISKAINGDRDRFVYDEKAQRVFKDMVREKVVDGKNYDEIVSEMEANPLLRGQKLNFQERESIQEELGRHKFIQEVLNDKSVLKDKTAVRSVMNRIADSAFVHDDTQLTQVLNNVDSRYQIQTHKDVLDYVSDIVRTFGPEQSERIAMNQGLNPARRQLLLARVADEYKTADNQKGLENMLTRIAYNATQYGQGVEATKLVYKLLGMTGGKGADAYIHTLIDGIQSKFLAAHKAEVDQLKKQIGDLKVHVNELMKTDKKVADSIKRALKKAKETGLKAQKAAIDQQQKLTAVLNKHLQVAKGKLVTPQDINNMRTNLAQGIRDALPLMPEDARQEYIERVGDLFNQHVKDINEGKLAGFYNDVMFPDQKPGVDKSTRVAEDIMNVVNAAKVANDKIDPLTLDAIRQKYGIDVNSREFTKGINELVDRANAHPEGLTAGTATKLKDDIAKFVMLHNARDTTNYAMKALGLTARDMFDMTPKERHESRKKISELVNKEIASLELNNSDPVANRWDIGMKVSDNVDRLLAAEKDRRNISKPENAHQDLLDFYNKTMFPDKSRLDTRDTQMADELAKVVNAADTVNGGSIDQHTLDAIQQKYGLTFASEGFAKSLKELVDRVNADPESRTKGADTRLKDDIAKLIRLYAVPDAIEGGGTALGLKVSDIATKLQSIQDGNLSDITDHLMKEYGKLGLTNDDAKALSTSIADQYQKLLKENANKFLHTSMGEKTAGKKQQYQQTFYDQVVKEVSALRLGDDRFQQMFAEKHGLKPFTPEDFNTLRDHAERAKFLKPGTSEYGQQVEKFFAHIQSKDPEYLSNLFKGLRASKLLFSIGFTMKTAYSNVAKIYTRGLIEYARSIKQGNPDSNILRLTFPNIQRLFGGEAFDKYASNYVKYVLDGGIPVSNTYEQEFAEHAGKINSRLEEYPLADDSWYTKTAKVVMKAGSRLQNSVDSYGQVRSSEIVQYARMLEGTAEEMKQINPNVTSDEIRQETQRRFALTDKNEAIQKALTEFTKNGVDIDMNSARFKNRVMEIQRENRDQQAFNFARNLSRVDFWKESEHGLMGGVGGLMETTLSKFRDVLRKPLETHPKAELIYDGAMFQVFGFLGGASRFYEDSLEHILPYSLIKAGLLQLGKNTDLTAEQKELIDRKQFDIIMKGAGTLLMSACAITGYNFMKSLATSHDDEKDKDKWGWFGSGKGYSLSESQLYKGLPKDGFLINGHKVPFDFVVPQQMDVPTRIYANMEDYARTNDEKTALMHFLYSGWHALPHSPWPGLLESVNEVSSAYGTDDYEKKRQKLQDVGYQKIGEFVTAYVPFPQRIISESYQLFDQGQKAKIEPTLPIAQGDNGLEAATKMFINFGARTIFSTGQALGINNIISTAGMLNKPAIDYRGREVNTGQQYSNSFASVPNAFNPHDAQPLPHDEIDELLVKKHADIAYYSRYGNAQMMFKGNRQDEDYTEINSEGEPIAKYQNEIRFMTDHEYYNFQLAMGKITDEELKSKYDIWTDLPAPEVKTELRNIQKNIFQYAKRGVESGMDADQIIASWKSGGQIDLPFPAGK